MERVTGIGGFFFVATDDAGAEPVVRRAPRRRRPAHRPTTGTVWMQEAGPTVFAPFGPEHAESPYLGQGRWGINFRVRDLDAMVDQLRAAGIEVEIDDEEYPNGRFAQLRDPEGNAVQLWEPAG